MRFLVLIAAFLSPFFLSIPVEAQSIKDIYEQAVEAYNGGRFKESFDLYEKITHMMPNFAPAYVGMGLTQMATGEDDEQIIQNFKLAQRYDPKYAPSFDTLGRFYYEKQDFDLAKENFEKALALDPNLYSSKISLAWVYLLAKGKPTKAIKLFKEAIKLQENPTNYYGLGLAYFSNNQRVEALDIVTKLRMEGKDDLAKRLEAMIRENRKVSNDQAKDSKPAGSSIADTADNLTTGIKVRLRESLPE